MSVSKINKQNSKKEKKIQNFSQLKGRNIITYSEKKKEEDFYEAMKEGYKAMALINSQYAEEGASGEYFDQIEYETWLCGVWYKWLVWM